MIDGRTSIVYRLYDSEGSLLYVGITSHGLARIDTHLAEKPWAPEIVWMRIERFASRLDAEACERDAIMREGPRHNVALRPQKGNPERGDQVRSTDREWFTVEEVSTMVRASPYSVRRWLRLGMVKGTRIGGRKLGWRIHQSEIERLRSEGIA